MAQPSLYKSGSLWIYSNGKSEATKTAPAGNYRRSEIGTMVAVFGKHNEFTLFSDKYIEVTTIQKSSTPGDNYISVAEFIGATEDFFVNPAPTGGIISGSVVEYADLPVASAHRSEIWYVENASGGFLSLLGIYKYPKELYSPNSSDVWEITPLNVKVAEDALTLVNIASWSEYFNFATDIGVGDRILFNGKIYINISGIQTDVSPPFDTNNWEASNEITWLYPFVDQTQSKGVMTKNDGWNVISNKLTSDYPFPQYIGAMQNPYEGKYPLSTVSAKQIISGIEFDNNDKDYYFEEFNIFTVKGYQYDQLIHIDPEGENKVVPISSFVAESNMISRFSIDKTIIEKGKKFRILSIITLPNSAAPSLTAEYYYDTNNFTPSLPDDGRINQGNRADGKRTMLISYIDNNGVDRTTFIQSLTAGDKISVGQDLDYTEWTIQKATIEATYLRVELWTEQIAPIQYTLTFSFYKIVDSNIQVVNDVDYWNTSLYLGSVKGVYGVNIGYSDAAAGNTARNISANIQEVDVSDDWDIMSSESVSPISLNSGTSLVSNIDDWSIYFKSTSGININDRIIYNGLTYSNLTGTQTSTNPSEDDVNWLLVDLTTAYNPIQLKAISKVNQPITNDAAGTIIQAEIIQETNGITLSNGDVTIGKSGFFRLQIQLNLNNANNTGIETWAEIYVDALGSWELLTDSGNIVETSNADAGNTNIETTITAYAGMKLRLKARVLSGAASLDYSILANTIGTPSCTFIVYELDPIVKGIAVNTEDITEAFVIGKKAEGNYFEVRTDGTIRLIGLATAYKDMLGDLFGRRLESNKGTVDYDYENNAIVFQSGGDINTANDRICTNSQINHEFKVGVSQQFFPHIHWFQKVISYNPVVLDLSPYTWTIQWRLIRNGKGVNLTTPEWQILTIINSVTSNVFDGSQIVDEEYLAQITKINTPLIVDCSISDTFQFQMARTDNETGDVLVFFFDEHGEVDGFGSDEEIAKY